MNPRELRAIAMRFTAAGRRVFPVELVTAADGSRTKKPGITRYHGTRPYAVGEIWRMPWHRATWLGMALYPGEVGLDVDVKNGKCGDEHLRELEDAYGALPATLRQLTPSGGEHRLLSSRFSGRLPGRLRLPGGTLADIDVIHSGNRYLVLYSPEQILDGLNGVAQLPEAWWPSMRRQKAHRVHPGPGAQASDAVEFQLERVRAARVYRNDTLNSAVFAAVLSGGCTDDDLDAFRIAAMAAGLERSEVDATVASASNAAVRRWEGPARWYRSVLATQDSWSPRQRVLMDDSAAHLALTVVHSGKSEIDMACRELADAMGVSAPTAAKVLRELYGRGWLTARDGEPRAARSYTLALPAAANSYKHPAPAVTAGTAVHTCMRASLPVFTKQSQTRLVLRRLAAFQAHGTGPVLPPASLAVAAELSVAPASLRELRDVTDLSASTIARAVRTLESTGVVRLSPEGLFMSAAPDLVAALQEWGHSMGLPDRSHLRRLQFASERESYQEHLDTLEADRLTTVNEPFLELMPIEGPTSGSSFSSWLFAPSTPNQEDSWT